MGGALDLASFRAQFPALERFVWLNTPTVPPAARPVLEALRRVEKEWEDGNFVWERWEAEADATRTLFARLIGADAGSIALVPSVAEAAATVAHSLPRGRIVVGEREFQSNLFPWLALQQAGFEVAQVPSVDGVVPTDDILEAIDGRTVLVAVTAVQSSNGFRLRLAEIAQKTRRVGARLFVNLTQSLGALRFTLAEIPADYVAVHGYKWLLGPRGAAWLYVRPDHVARTSPLAPSWKSVPNPYADYYGGPYELAPDARRLDASLAWFPWVGARAALELILSLDAEAVETRCLQLAASFRERARERGFRLTPEEVPSQIVGLLVEDPEGLRDRLARQRVVAAVRGGFLRVGFHAFNDEGDLSAALTALGKG